MRFSAFISRRIVQILLVSLVVLIAADLAQVTRASGLNAVACTSSLFADERDAYGLPARYRDEILAQAERTDLPPELLAAVIINHQLNLPRLRRFTDCFGSAVGADLSLGLAQVRLSTAARIDGFELKNLSAPEYRALRSRLLNPAQNIAYQAGELRALLEQKNRFPGLSAQGLIHDPPAMALLITEYRVGRLDTPSDSSRLSNRAFGALRLIHSQDFGEFERDPDDLQAVKSAIREYLSFINCESGIFNAGVCESWQRSLGRSLSRG